METVHMNPDPPDEPDEPDEPTPLMDVEPLPPEAQGRIEAALNDPVGWSLTALGMWPFLEATHDLGGES